MKSRKISIRVCIIMPAYNESKVIGSVVASTLKQLNSSHYSGDVVVIDDGSKDNTASEAKKHGAMVVRHIINIGVGGATATGLSYAQQNGYDIAAIMDSDGQHIPEDVIRGIDELIVREHDLLIGSRLINSDGMSKVKIIGNWGLSTITYLLFGIRSTDSQSGMRIFSKKALDQLRWRTSGYEFCSEMLWRANQLKLLISEYPIKAIYTDYSLSKGQNNWNGVNILKSLLMRRILEFLQ